MSTKPKAPKKTAKKRTSIMRTEKSQSPQVRHSEKVAAAIFERMMEGESLRSICRSKAMPAFSSTMRWILEKPEFAALYQIAQDIRAQNLADQILDIADTPAPGERTKVFADGSTETVICDQVERSKLKIHAREWTLARLAPKRYGNRVLNEITGAAGEPLTGTVQEPRPTVEQVAVFSKAIYLGFQSYQHPPTGEHAPLDEQNIGTLSEFIADYASGGDTHGPTSEPEKTGNALAMGFLIRKHMVRPPGMMPLDPAL